MHARDIVIAGEQVAVRGKVIEHYGDDLLIEFASPRGTWRVNVGKSQIIDRVEINPASAGGDVHGTDIAAHLAGFA